MRALSVLLFFCLMAWPAEGQTIWSRPYEPGQIAVEAMVPDLPEEATFPSGATFLTGTLSLSDNIEFAGELPLARYAPSTGVDSTAQTTVGNPYFGLGFSSTSLPLMIEVGARLPLASSSPALQIGDATDMGRTGAFSREEFSLSALVNGRTMLGRWTSLRLRSGFVYASFPTIDDQGNEQTSRDWRLLYSAQLWREGDAAILGLSFTGRTILNAPGRFGAVRQHHLVGSLMGNYNIVQPGLLMGLSLSDLPDEASLLFGVTLSISYAR